MSYHLDDTIAAIASAPGGAPRGIVRLSGPEARQCVEAVFEPAPREQPLAGVRRATAINGHLRLPQLNSLLPCDLYVWPNERSYTRQPVVEIHTFGSPPLLECVLSNVCNHGARLAEPGEFTLRAFLAGRFDLTQAEAVLGVIDARDRREFDVALRQLAGGIAGPMTTLREDLLELLAHLEAGLDFVEEDIEFISARELETRLAAAAEAVARLADQMTGRAESRELVRTALIGWPNVGKSSLFNALVGHEQAIVSPLAGTTRDYLTAELDLDGVRVQLIDTAGVEECGMGNAECGVESEAAKDSAEWETEIQSKLHSEGPTPHFAFRTPHSGLRTAYSVPVTPPSSIDSAAQQLSAQQREAAQLHVLCLDSTRPLNAWERQQLADSSTQPGSSRQVVALTKCDEPFRIDLGLQAAVRTSARSGQGLDELRRQLREAAAASHGQCSVVAATATRCRESLRRAAESLERAQRLTRDGAGEELTAAETRAALHELGRVVGAVYTDDLLDRIFSRFCIGK